MGKRIVLFNPLANNGKGEDNVEEAVTLIGGEASCFDVTVTDVKKLVGSLGEDDTVVLCGGDGTINVFANNIADIEPKCSVYLMKSGTGNDFLKDVDPQGSQKFIKLNDYLKDLPICYINGKEIRFINNVGFGVDGAVCEVADENKANGKKVNYTTIALKLLLLYYHAPNATVTVDGVTKSYKKVWMAPVMNGKYYGGGMKVAPMQDRNSDKLSSIVVFNAGRLKMLARFSSVFSGEHIRYKDMVDWHYANEVTVTYDRPTAVQIDGETISGVTTFTVKKKPREENK